MDKTRTEEKMCCEINKPYSLTPAGMDVCYTDPAADCFRHQTRILNTCFNELHSTGKEAQLRIITYLWDAFQLDDFKREKQIAVQKQLKEAQK